MEAVTFTLEPSLKLLAQILLLVEIPSQEIVLLHPIVRSVLPRALLLITSCHPVNPNNISKRFQERRWRTYVFNTTNPMAIALNINLRSWVPNPLSHTSFGYPNPSWPNRLPRVIMDTGMRQTHTKN
jgi:hypothetical protein